MTNRTLFVTCRLYNTSMLVLLSVEYSRTKFTSTRMLYCEQSHLMSVYTVSKVT